MIRFARALLGGTLLSSAYAELAISGKYPLQPSGQGVPGIQEEGFAYGPVAAIFNSQRIAFIAGGSAGESTWIDMYPGLGWDVVILSNYDHIDIVAIAGAEWRAITQQA